MNSANIDPMGCAAFLMDRGTVWFWDSDFGTPYGFGFLTTRGRVFTGAFVGPGEDRRSVPG